jgi:hypothetical protein
VEKLLVEALAISVNILQMDGVFAVKPYYMGSEIRLRGGKDFPRGKNGSF